MDLRDIIVIGGSAGAVEAMRRLCAYLPKNLPAAVFVVIHVPSHAKSALPEILTRAGPLTASHARDGEEFENGRIYVGSPDHHLLVDGRHVLVRRGPRENRQRPSVDALFRSAAYTLGPRVVGVVLSGALDDGTSGLWSIKRLGGITIAQSPEDAAYPEMPRSAIEQVEIDHVASIDDIAGIIATRAGEPVPAKPDISSEDLRRVGTEIDIASRGGAFDKGIMNWGDIAPFTCPECHGCLVRFDEGSRLRLRCHTGHAYTPRALLAGMNDAIEATLWQALRGLNEQTAMLEDLAEHFAGEGRTESAARMSDRARESKERARNVEDCLPRLQDLGHDIA